MTEIRIFLSSVFLHAGVQRAHCQVGPVAQPHCGSNEGIQHLFDVGTVIPTRAVTSRHYHFYLSVCLSGRQAEHAALRRGGGEDVEESKSCLLWLQCKTNVTSPGSKFLQMNSFCEGVL